MNVNTHIHMHHSLYVFECYMLHIPIQSLHISQFFNSEPKGNRQLKGGRCIFRSIFVVVSFLYFLAFCANVLFWMRLKWFALLLSDAGGAADWICAYVYVMDYVHELSHIYTYWSNNEYVAILFGS